MSPKNRFPFVLTAGALVLAASLGASAAAAADTPAVYRLVELDAFTGTTVADLAARSSGVGIFWGQAILGGEREALAVPSADGAVTLRFVWDGEDGDPWGLDHTGLGGMDLTESGALDILVLEAAVEGAGAEVRFTVFSDPERSSVATLALEPVGGVQNHLLPLAAFAAADGSGADLRDVGALVMEVAAGEAQVRLHRLAAASSSPSAPVASPRPGLAHRGPAISVDVILQDGDTPSGAPGTTVTALNVPVVNSLGDVGFTGTLDTGAGTENFVWSGSSVAWRNSSAVGATLTGAEAVSGIGDTGQFIYSPSIDGNDGVWTQAGELARENVQAPGFPAGTNSTFHSRPTMAPTGQAYWVAGFDDTGGTTTQGRMLYTSTDGTPGTISVVLRSDDMVGGTPIDRPSGIDFDYHFSDDGAHHISVLLLDTGSTTDDGIVYVDGSIIAQEASPAAGGIGGENWDNFDVVNINDAGNYVFSGDTDGATGTDEFIAYNGTIAIREGDTLDGFTLTSAAAVRFAGINDFGQAVHAWNVSGGTEVLFFACDASDLANTSQVMLMTGDQVDVDGDTMPDATVTDFNTFTSGRFLFPDTGDLYVEVDLDYGAGNLEAMLHLEPPSCLLGADLVINEVDYDQSAVNDGEEFVEIYNPTGSSINLDPYFLELVDGDGGGASVYSLIPLPDVDLGPGEFFVVCADGANVPGCDLDVMPDTDLIENGAPDAVALRAGILDGVSLIDTVSYEGDTGVPYTEGSGVGLEDDPATDFFSISRVVDGQDTGQNNVDFAGRCNSPGLPNMSTVVNCQLVPVELMHFSIE